MQTLVYWDTCAYREIIKTEYKRPKHAQSIEDFAAYISSLEKESGYQTPPYALVLWELISHLPAFNALLLPDTKVKDWEADFRSCFFACKFVKHQSFRENGNYYTPFPQTLLAGGIEMVLHGVSIQEKCKIYDANARAICTYIANFDDVIADRKTWRQAPELIEVAREMIHTKRQWNNRLVDELRKLKVQEPRISQESFVCLMKDEFVRILYDCIQMKYWIFRDQFKYMHTVSDAFVEKWARSIYINVRDVECVSDWVYKNKLSNTFVDALLLAIMSDRQEETQFIFVTMDDSILYQNAILQSSNHKIVDLHEYLRGIGAKDILPD